MHSSKETWHKRTHVKMLLKYTLVPLVATVAQTKSFAGKRPEQHLTQKLWIRVQEEGFKIDPRLHDSAFKLGFVLVALHLPETGQPHTMRFGSTAKVLAKCKLKYYKISECPIRRARKLGL